MGVMERSRIEWAAGKLGQEGPCKEEEPVRALGAWCARLLAVEMLTAETREELVEALDAAEEVIDRWVDDGLGQGWQSTYGQIVGTLRRWAEETLARALARGEV